MKKIIVFFALSWALIFVVSCGGSSKTGDTTDTGETVADNDGDSGDSEPADDSEPSGDTDSEDPENPDTTPDNNNSDDSDNTEVLSDPCSPNPCDGTKNSTGLCLPVGTHYICECKTNYVWKWNEKKCKNIKIESLSVSNICTNSKYCISSYTSGYYAHQACGDWSNSQSFGYSSSTECPSSPDSDFFGQDQYYADNGFCKVRDFSIDNSIPEEPTLIDKNTKLEWSQKAKHYSGYGSYKNSLAFCNNLTYGGHEDWRQPTLNELLSIKTYDFLNDDGKSDFFPDIKCPSSFVTAEQDFCITCGGGYYPAYYCDINSYSDYYNILCVRGISSLIESTYLTQTINGDNVIKDEASGLMWEQSYGENLSWEESLAYCKNLTYAGYNDWRLPNRNELITFPEELSGDIIPSSTYSSVNNKECYLNSVYYSSTIDFWIKAPDLTIVTNSFYSNDAQVKTHCVRGSVLDLENDNIQNEENNESLPECSSTSPTPCKDSTSNLVWSAKAEHPMSWKYAIKYCDDLTEGGYNNWHLPTISELRTLVQHCTSAVTGGICKISDSCLSASCTNNNDCNCSNDEIELEHDKFGDRTRLWSSSICPDCSNYEKIIWTISSTGHEASISSCPEEEYNMINNDVRCVR